MSSMRVEFGSHVPAVGDLVIVQVPDYTEPARASTWWWARVKEVHRGRGVEAYATLAGAYQLDAQGEPVLAGAPAFAMAGMEPCPAFADTPCTRRLVTLALRTHKQTTQAIHDLSTRLNERRRDGVAMGRLAESLVGALQAVAPRS